MILFIKQLIEDMGIKVKTPIIVRMDNVGAMYIATNPSTNTRTRHIDIRYHFVREHVENGVIQIIFVRTDENTADIFTKNVKSELHEKHTKGMVKNKPSEK